MTDFRLIATTILTTVVTYVRRIFAPCLDDILADFRRKIAQIDALIDAENGYCDQQVQRRRELRAEITASWNEQEAAEQRAAQASAVRDNLRGIINA